MTCQTEVIKDDDDLSCVLNNFIIDNPERKVMFYIISLDEVKIFYEGPNSEV